MGIPSDTASRNYFIKGYQKYQEEVLLKTCYLFIRPEKDNGCSQYTVCVVPGRILDSVNSRNLSILLEVFTAIYLCTCSTSI